MDRLDRFSTGWRAEWMDGFQISPVQSSLDIPIIPNMENMENMTTKKGTPSPSPSPSLNDRMKTKHAGEDGGGGHKMMGMPTNALKQDIGIGIYSTLVMAGSGFQSPLSPELRQGWRPLTPFCLECLR